MGDNTLQNNKHARVKENVVTRAQGETITGSNARACMRVWLNRSQPHLFTNGQRRLCMGVF